MEIEKLYEQFINSTGVSTDTRKIERGNIFFALKGENFNANLFVEQALSGGASLVIADEKHFPENGKIILVPNVLEALQQLANYHRLKCKAEVIAIAGSNGKTTTKELVSRILETTYKTISTQGNLNNHIGVPLTLLSIMADTRIAVVEMGANHLGEIRLLCEIADPDYGLITNNGKDHLEGYGTIEGVRKGNGELYDFLRRKDGVALVCSNQDDLMRMSEGITRVTYGESEDADCKGKIIRLFPFLQLETFIRRSFNEGGQNFKLETQLIGKYNFENVMAAVCVGKFFGVDIEKIRQAVAGYSPSNNRSQVLKKGSNTFILDAYNANPSSMNAALENFFEMPVENKMVILGDMAELGEASESEHKAILAKLQNSDLKLVYLVGNEFEKVMKKSKVDFPHFQNVDELKTWFDRQKIANHYILMKGSRVVGLEKLIS